MIDLLVRKFVGDSADVRSSAVRQRYGALSGGVGIVLNLLLSLAKFVAGALTGSIAVTADAFNNLSDAGSSVVTLLGFRLAGKEPDDDHPFGHGRIEYLSGLVVAGAILLVGVELGKSALGKILQPEEVAFSRVSVVILAVSILVKLWMSVFNRALSARIGSTALAATAADSLSDVVATAAVLLGTLAGHFFRWQIDGWVGILVAAFILKAGWEAARDTLNPLLGQSPDPELVRGIRDTVLSHGEIRGIHDLVVHDYGPGRRMCSLHAEVSVDGDLLALHDVVDAAEREIKRKYRIEASIHMDPVVTGDEAVLRHRTRVEALVRDIDSAMSIHDFRMTDGPHHRNLIFDVVVPCHFKGSDEALRAEIDRRVKGLGENCFAVVEIDRAYTET